MPTQTYTPIANITLTATTSSVLFSGISQSYRDIVLIANGTNVVSSSNLRVIINADTGTSTYYGVNMAYTQASTTSNPNPGEVIAGLSWSMWRSTPSFVKMDFLDYSATDKHKSVLVRSGNSAEAVEASTWRWANTAAITSLRVHGGMGFGSNYYLAAGTTLALYGIAS